MEPCDCPGDLNGDGKRNLEDFALFSEKYWLQDCPTQIQMPVYVVTQTGVTSEQQAALAQILGVDVDEIPLVNGQATHIKPAEFLKVPTQPFTDQGIIDELTRETESDEGQLQFEMFDYEAIQNMTPYPEEDAMKKTADILRQADLLPANAMSETTHSFFDVFDVQGQPIVQDAMMDTQVLFNFMLSDIPMIGPGAKVSMAFGEQGQVTHLLYANREVTPGEMVNVIPMSEAAQRCAQAYPDLGVSTQPQLIYYAPDLSMTGVQALIPCIQCGGTGKTASGEEFNLMDKIIPATDDPRFVPSVALNVNVVPDNLVMADVQVSGGAPPYAYNWSSSSTELPPFAENSIEYNAIGRMTGLQTETVQVIVTDSNGVQVSSQKTVAVNIPAPEPGGVAQVGGVRDYGIERAVSDLGGPEQAGYKARMDTEAFRRFNWTGASSWERDFKDLNMFATGLDHNYTDNVDQTLYIGHGSGTGFTFESSQDDGAIRYNTDVAGAWGNKDLEWMALLSCQVLKDTADGKKWYTRWGPAFNGLHLLLGYQTNAAAGTNTPGVFADWQLGRFFFLPPVPVRTAWCLAKKEQQPNDRQAVVMGVVGPGGVISGWNDYFWGQGSVGPDLRGSNITAYWRIVYQ